MHTLFPLDEQFPPRLASAVGQHTIVVNSNVNRFNIVPAKIDCGDTTKHDFCKMELI
jgi:hypothetical protein